MRGSMLLSAALLIVTSTAAAQEQPKHVRSAETIRILWGDEVSGKVHDSRFHGGDRLMFQIFGMEPGQIFRHSDRFSTLFLVDGIYYVLTGTLYVNNPATGEVHRIDAGELAFLPRNHWNHGFAYSTEPVRVLEYLPRLTQGARAPYSVDPSGTKLTPPRYTQDQWLGRWPAAQEEARRQWTHQPVRQADILWRLEGEKNQVLVGIMASTDQITMGKILLQPGQETDLRVHGGDAGIYVEQGQVHVRLTGSVLDERGQINWFDAHQGDGVFLPAGTPHQYYNPTAQPATLIFGVSADYLPKPAR